MGLLGYSHENLFSCHAKLSSFTELGLYRKPNNLTKEALDLDLSQKHAKPSQYVLTEKSQINHYVTGYTAVVPVSRRERPDDKKRKFCKKCNHAHKKGHSFSFILTEPTQSSRLTSTKEGVNCNKQMAEKEVKEGTQAQKRRKRKRVFTAHSSGKHESQSYRRPA